MPEFDKFTNEKLLNEIKSTLEAETKRLIELATRSETTADIIKAAAEAKSKVTALRDEFKKRSNNPDEKKQQDKLAQLNANLNALGESDTLLKNKLENDIAELKKTMAAPTAFEAEAQSADVKSQNLDEAVFAATVAHQEVSNHDKQGMSPGILINCLDLYKQGQALQQQMENHVSKYLKEQADAGKTIHNLVEAHSDIPGHLELLERIHAVEQQIFERLKATYLVQHTSDMLAKPGQPRDQVLSDHKFVIANGNISANVLGFGEDSGNHLFGAQWETTTECYARYGKIMAALHAAAMNPKNNVGFIGLQEVSTDFMQEAFTKTFDQKRWGIVSMAMPDSAWWSPDKTPHQGMMSIYDKQKYELIDEPTADFDNKRLLLALRDKETHKIIVKVNAHEKYYHFAHHFTQAIETLFAELFENGFEGHTVDEVHYTADTNSRILNLDAMGHVDTATGSVAPHYNKDRGLLMAFTDQPDVVITQKRDEDMRVSRNDFVDPRTGEITGEEFKLDPTAVVSTVSQLYDVSDIDPKMQTMTYQLNTDTTVTARELTQILQKVTGNNHIRFAHGADTHNQQYLVLNVPARYNSEEAKQLLKGLTDLLEKRGLSLSDHALTQPDWHKDADQTFKRFFIPTGDEAAMMKLIQTFINATLEARQKASADALQQVTELTASYKSDFAAKAAGRSSPPAVGGMWREANPGHDTTTTATTSNTM